MVTASLLAIALNEMGVDAIAMSGGQAGIITDNFHTYARIKSIDTVTYEKRAQQEVELQQQLVFQGMNSGWRDNYTWKVGGSDLSAVAIAGATWS